MTINIQPPPTWTLPIDTKSGSFDPVWLKWFIDLAGVLNQNSGSPHIQHNSLGGLQGGKVGPPTEYYHLTSAQDGLLTSGTAHQVLHGDPTLPTWSAVSLTADVSGVSPVANGGTNSSTALSGSSIAISNGTAIVQGAAGTTTTVLHGNASGAPTYSAISLTVDVSGTLPPGNGGIGNSTVPSSGQLPIGNAGNTAYAPQSMSGDATISNAGALTLATVATASTNTKITFNVKGLVTSAAAATLASSDFANQGTTTTVLHGNAAGNPSFAAVSLTADVSGITPAANGGTNNGFTQFSGPATSAKTFTLPNASDTVACIGQSQTWTANQIFNGNTQLGSALSKYVTLGAFAPAATLDILQQLFCGAGLTLGGQNGATGEASIGWNFYYSGGYKYRLADVAMRIGFNSVASGSVTIETAPSGSVDGAITWAKRFEILSGAQIGSPTGGDKGAGTLNAASGVYDNGNRLATLAGTTTNDNAAAGNIGEYVTASVASASSVSLTSTTTANVTSISLTAGDWDVYGIVDYTAAGTTVVTALKQGSSSTSATLGAVDTFSTADLGLTGPTNDPAIVIPTVRFSLSTTTTIYLVTNAVFSTSTLKAYGTIRARRMR